LQFGDKNHRENTQSTDEIHFDVDSNNRTTSGIVTFYGLEINYTLVDWLHILAFWRSKERLKWA